MANPYTSVSVSGYNSNPPADDGSEVEANRVKWSTIKTKLPDPLKTALDQINANLLTAFARVVGGGGVTTTSISYTVQSTDQGKLVVATTSGITITTPDATGVDDPFVWMFSNDSSGDVTLDGNGSQTIDGDSSVTVPRGKGLICLTDGANWFTAGRNWELSVLPAGHLFGLTMSNAADTTNDITIAAGRCRDSSNTVDMIIGSALTKQIDASWVVGNNQGGRSSSGLADDTWHLFVIGKDLGASADVLFHNAVDPSAVLPTDYLYYRRIGSVVRTSSAIKQFVQFGDKVNWVTPVLDVNTNTGTTSGITSALSVPTDIRVVARCNCYLDVGGAIYLSALDQDNTSPGPSTASLSSSYDGGNQGGGYVEVLTNTSGQIRVRANTGSGACQVATLGYIDTRGRDA